jgi:asparagine synthase (glutamine-hydrolysing)
MGNLVMILLSAEADAAASSFLERTARREETDGAEVVLDRSLLLSYRRTPSSSTEARLLSEPSRGLSVVMTGRLYNRLEVLALLEDAGRLPRVDSDAAIVLSSYALWGQECLGRFDGDFSFALYDRSAGIVFAATDALGVKPLYYSFDGGRFLCASTPPSLFAAGISREPCEEKIAAYLSLGPYLSGGPRTFYRDVHRLEPGCYLVVAGGSIATKRYWQIDPARENEERTNDAMNEKLSWLMRDSVRRRMSEDPPHACALSGGFDSSCVAALLRRSLTEQGIDLPLETFSFELRDEDADEPEIIDAVATAVRARHHHVYVDRDNAFQVLPDLVDALNGPISDLGLLLLWRKKQEMARLGVSTVLSGLGGDEVFLGRWQHLADLLRAGRLTSLYQEVRGLYPIDPNSGRRTSALRLLKDYMVLPLLPWSWKKQVRRLLLRERVVGPWIAPGLARRTKLADRLKIGPPRVYRDHYRQEAWETLNYPLLGELLPAHEGLGRPLGVETRFPLLDRRIVEFMFAAPRETKIDRGHSRILQRSAMKGLLPEIVVQQHRKKDFHPSLGRQQRPHFTRELEAVLSRPNLASRDFVDWEHIRQHYPSYLQGGTKAWFPILYAVSLENWLGKLRATDPA